MPIIVSLGCVRWDKGQERKLRPVCNTGYCSPVKLWWGINDEGKSLGESKPVSKRSQTAEFYLFSILKRRIIQMVNKKGLWGIMDCVRA